MRIFSRLTSKPVTRMMKATEDPTLIHNRLTKPDAKIMRASEDPLLIHNRLTDPKAIDKALDRIAREPLSVRIKNAYTKLKELASKLFVAF